MAKFVYRMQNILDIKLRLETQVKTEFAEASAKLAQEEEKLRKLIEKRKEYERELKRLSEDKLELEELKRCSGYIQTLKELMQQQALAVRIAQRNLDKVRERLNQAMQERKIYEKLREKAFEEFKEELNAEEKKEIDQLVSFTYNDKNRDSQ